MNVNDQSQLAIAQKRTDATMAKTAHEMLISRSCVLQNMYSTWRIGFFLFSFFHSRFRWQNDLSIV